MKFKYYLLPVTQRLLFMLLFGLTTAIWPSLASPFDNNQDDTNARRPNILLILADDLGWSDLGSYGSEVSTPTLDELAFNGVRFTQFTNTSKCFPTRASLLTGQYAKTVGVDKSWRPNWKRTFTIATALKRAGYSTLMVGKHHGSDNPVDLGFDHYWGVKSGAANHFNPGYQRPDEPVPAQKRPLERAYCFNKRCLQPFTPEKGFYSTDAFTDWSIQLLKNKESSDQPFFLYLSYTAPHDPLQIPKEDRNLYQDQYKKGYDNIARQRYQKQVELGLINQQQFPFSASSHQNWDSLSPDLKNDEVARMEVYAAMIHRMDRQIARLFDYLKTSGQFNDTLIVFLSDNGASAEVVEVGTGPIGNIDRWSSLGEHWASVSNVPFKRFKNYSYGGGINTPLIVHWPGVIAPNRISHYPGHVIDLLPTLADIARATTNVPHELKVNTAGRSLIQHWLHEKHDDTHTRATPLFYAWQNQIAVWHGKWKLVGTRVENTGADYHFELFDMLNDKTETQDLAGKYPGIVDSLYKQFTEWELSNPN